MNLPPEVDQAAQRLLDVLRGTSALREYAQTREAVMAQDDLRLLVRRYERVQAALQLAAMTGTPPRESDQAEFEHLGAIVYESDEAAAYLLSRMRAQQLVAATMDRLTAEVGLNVDIRES